MRRLWERRRIADVDIYFYYNGHISLTLHARILRTKASVGFIQKGMPLSLIFRVFDNEA
jgi:hypothetical protein